MKKVRDRATRVMLPRTAMALVAAVVATSAAEGQRAAERDSSLLQRLVIAEDGRRRDPMAVAVFHQGLRSSDSLTRRVAVRALGRLENSANYSAIARALVDSSPGVRAEAANAMGQIVRPQTPGAPAGGVTAVQVRDALSAHLASERDSYVRGVVARTIGRLPYGSRDDAERAARVVLGVKAHWDAPQSVAAPLDSAAGTRLARWATSDTVVLRAWLDVAHGMESVFRRNPTLRVADIVPAAAPQGAGDADHPAGGRAAALSQGIRGLLAFRRGRALAQGSPGSAAPAATSLLFGRSLSDDATDPDPWVRRIAVALAPNAAALGDSARLAIVRRALGDPSGPVRLEAVRAYARRAPGDCGPLLSAVRDTNAHVALAAIDALGTACASAPGVADTLAGLVARLPALAARRSGRGSWHYGAHAIVSLGRVAPARARSEMPRLAAHPIWQVRMYAARAAAEAGDTARLVGLAADRHDNVREAAVDALARLLGRGDTTRAAAPEGMLGRRADSVFVAQLTRTDYQLLLTAARSLRGTSQRTQAIGSLLTALDRITRDRRETSRDPRMEILARVGELGAAEHARRLEPYLRDFDPVVAARAAEILRQWGIADAVAAPRPPAPAEVSLAAVARLRDSRVRVTMAPASGGGSFELRLFPDEAPATVARFATLVRRRYYDGLTFHRVAPNFVLQGGSSGANEYVGDGPYMRDELGLRSHTRGTLGISTRGRDTGDAQIFINLVDNWRLDHDYTVFAEIVSGMDVVDRILEGDVMQRVEILGETRR